MASLLNPSERRRVLVATAFGSSMAFIDTTIVNVALPNVQSALGASAAEAQWVVESYMMVLGALILVGGALGDRFGQMRVFKYGVATFAVASIACGAAPNATFLIFARLAQGLAGALLVPSSLALLAAAYPPEERATAIGTWSAFAALATMLGPPVGGGMVMFLSWRAVFYVNLIFAGAALWSLRPVPSCTEPDPTRKLDGIGALLASLGLGGVAFGLTEAGPNGLTHPEVLVALVLGSLCLGAFIVHEAKTDNPMMPLNLFACRAFSGANLVTIGLYASLSGMLFYLPFVVMQVDGKSSFEAGLFFFPIALVISLMSRWSARLADRVGAGTLLSVGAGITGIGFLGLAETLGCGDLWRYLPPAIMLGVGMGFCVAPLTSTVMTSVPPGRTGIASGVNNAVSRIAQGMAVAGFGLLVQHSFAVSIDAKISSLSPSEQRVVLAQREKLAGAELPDSWSEPRREYVQGLLNASFIDATRKAGWMAALLSFGSAAVALTMLGRGSTSRPLQPSPPKRSGYRAYLPD